jgi:CBS domain-containing protein
MKCIKAVVAGRETVTVAPTLSVTEASRVMARHDIGAVPVVDGERLAGIFTERDILARVVAAGLDCSATPVGDVMSTGLIVADLEETYEACLQRMKQARVRHLIVLDRGRLAGILSLRDLLAMDLDDKDEAIALLNAYVHYIPADMQTKARV